MVIFALLVSSVFGVLMKDQPREQLRLGGILFVAFVGCALVVAWLMYPFPR
jgi:hypothetical protein